jgi:hypothetical protein
MRTCLTLITLILFSSVNASGEADEKLSPVALLHRCYLHLTQTRIPNDHPSLAAVKLSGADPIAECLQFLDSTSMIRSGANEGLLLSPSSERLALMRTFNNLHRTWFPRDSMRNNIASGEVRPTEVIYDEGEAALHVTRTLLQNGLPFSEVVTGASSLEGLRTGGPVSNLSGPGDPRIGTMISREPLVIAPLDVDLVQRGDLMGIRPVERNGRKVSASFESTLVDQTPPPLHKSNGGGILGTRSYLLLNLGRREGEIMNGGVIMPREYSKAIFNDLLCRDIPVVRLEDARPYVQTSPSASTPPFRTSANCMGCHASLDPLAGIGRQFTLRFSRVDLMPLSVSAYLQELATASPRESGQVDADGLFYRRPPTGRFYFRDHAGKLHNQPVNHIADFGNYLAQLDDLYLCAASRYFQYFTGIRISFRDYGDAAAAPQTDEEREYSQMVRELGLDFKRHQNLKTLVRKIMESPIYGLTQQRTHRKP